MSFIRPDALARLMRWRDVMVAVVIGLAGAWWALTSLGLIRWSGVALVVIAGALGWAGWQRARFRGGHGGLGLVQVDERQITYLAPVGGGFASLDALVRVEIAPDMAGFPVWRFHSLGEVLTVPTSAEGTETLFEVLTALPGVDMEAAIRASRGRPAKPVVIWQRAGGRGGKYLS